MDVLVNLLGIEAPANTHLKAAELSLRGLLPLWLAAALLGVLAIGVLLLYRLEKGVGWPRRVLMAGLRVALLGLLILLLLRPVLLTEFAGKKPRGIVLLLDNSQSMRQQDRRMTQPDKLRVAIADGSLPATTPVVAPGSQAILPSGTPTNPARADLVRSVLRPPSLNLVEELGKIGPVRPMLFGYSVHGIGGEGAGTAADLLKSFTADEARTCLADAIHDILERKDGALPAAIVVMTDGQDNASKYTLGEVGLACGRHNVPLHIYGVGTAEGGILQLKEVGVPETIFVDDAITVPVRWRSHGLDKSKVAVNMTLGGKVVAQREIANASGDDVRAELSFTVPKSKQPEASVDLVVTLEVKGNDAFKDSLSQSVRIIDRKIRVLYIENSARFVYQFMMAGLLRDRRMDATFLLVNADPKAANAGPPFVPALPPTRAQFFDAHYNVIVLGDVAAGYLGKEHMEWIKEFVQKGGGLIAIAGRQHMPSTYIGTPLAEVLPAEFEAKRFPLGSEPRTQEYPVTLSDIGRRSGMLALADTPDESVSQWSKLPGFHWQYPMLKLRSGAVSLLMNPRVKMGEQPMPLLASQYYGKGQVLFMGSDETWRWRFNEEDKITNRFWGQLIYQVGLPSLLGQTSKRAQIALAGSAATLNVPGSIFVRLLDRNFNPRKDAEIDAMLNYLDAKPGQEKLRKVALYPIPGRDGEYSAMLAHDQPGRWELTVNNPKPVSFRFHVDVPPRHELEDTGLAENALRELARVSGGKFYHEEDLHRLAGAIKPQSMGFTQRQEVLLWNPLVLVLFALLITAEWLLRKFANLS